MIQQVWLRCTGCNQDYLIDEADAKVYNKNNKFKCNSCKNKPVVKPIEPFMTSSISDYRTVVISKDYEGKLYEAGPRVIESYAGWTVSDTQEWKTAEQKEITKTDKKAYKISANPRLAQATLRPLLRSILQDDSKSPNEKLSQIEDFQKYGLRPRMPYKTIRQEYVQLCQVLYRIGRHDHEHSLKLIEDFLANGNAGYKETHFEKPPEYCPICHSGLYKHLKVTNYGKKQAFFLICAGCDWISQDFDRVD